MGSRSRFRILSALGTTCRVVGWILVVLAILTAVTAIVTAAGWEDALTNAEVFLGSLIGGLLLVAQGQLIKAVLSIEKNTRP